MAGFKKVQVLGSDERYRKDLSDFVFKLDAAVKDTATFYYPFDSLKKCIPIHYSPDKRIRFYFKDIGYDSPAFIAYAQVVVSTGNIVLQDLCKPKNVLLNYLIYEVHEVVIDSVKHYVAFGWGSHGHSYATVHIFKLVKNNLAECFSCFENNKPPEFMYNYFGRGLYSRLVFDPLTNNIGLKLYEREKSPESVEPTTKLYFVNGKYEEK